MTLRIAPIVLILGITGCGGAQLSAAPALQQQPARQAAQRDRGRSWMLPEAKSRNLLYVSNVFDVTVYTYPAGKLVGTLSNFDKPYGECVDAKGNVYITDSSFGRIFEYPHGGTKPIATLADKQYQPYGCAIDPTTGNLAVANYETTWDYPGNLAIYRKARGFPESYVVEGLYYYYYCGYDPTGNLYVDGLNNGGFNFSFARLPKNSHTLQPVLLPQTITFPGGVQWDGKYVAVGDQGGEAIYQFSFTKGQPKLQGHTPLSGAGLVGQFGIDAATVAAPNQANSTSNVLLYNYPAGGNPTLTITDGVSFPFSAVVSRAGALKHS